MTKNGLETAQKAPFPSATSASPWGWLLVLLLSLLFLANGYPGVERLCYRTDELATLQSVESDSLKDAINYSKNHDKGNVLYAVVTFATAKKAGISKKALRLPALAFATLCIFVFYVLARRIGPSGLAGVSTIVFALSPTLLYVGMDARGFSLFLLISLLFYLFILRSLDSGALFDRIATAAALVVLAFMSRYAWPVIASGALLGYFYSITREKYVAGESVGVVAGNKKIFLIAALLSLLAAFLSGGLPAGDLFDGRSIADAIAIAYVGAAGGFSKSNTSLAFVHLLLIATGLFLLRKKRSGLFALLISWAFLIFVGMALVYKSSNAEIMEAAGYLVVVSFPVVTILAASGIYTAFAGIANRDASQIYSIGQFLRILIGGLLIIGVTFSMVVLDGICLRQVLITERENWPASSEHVLNNLKDGDVVYYFKDDELAIKYYFEHKRDDVEWTMVGVENEEQLQRELKKNNSGWIVRLFPSRMDESSESEFWTSLRKGRSHLWYEGCNGYIETHEIDAIITND